MNKSTLIAMFANHAFMLHFIYKQAKAVTYRYYFSVIRGITLIVEKKKFIYVLYYLKKSIGPLCLQNGLVMSHCT